MTLEFRDHQILVISPGSRLTQVQMGLSESLMPPAFEIPTLVYRDDASGKLCMTPTEQATPVHPIVKGAIADEEAFHYMLKMIYKSVKPVDGLPPAMFLVASLAWTRRQTERIARYLFEEAGVPALTLSLQGTSTSYAFATSDCLVIDVGLDKTEITAVLQFEGNRHASAIVDIGGSSVNSELSSLLPSLSASQIEDLKQSPIYEVLDKVQSSANASRNTNNSMVDEDEGVVDIAAIVSSGRTREILSQREKEKQGESQEVPNAERNENNFVDRNGQEVTVGQERFKGTEKLMGAIVDAVADVLYNLYPKDQEHVFENIVFTGKGSLIPGFRAVLADNIESRYVIRPHGAAGVIANAEEIESPSQGPSTLTVSRLPDHFPEWKNRRWEDYTFLGAQIGAKQVFTTGMEGLFISRPDYNEIGPSSIWDVLS